MSEEIPPEVLPKFLAIRLETPKKVYHLSEEEMLRGEHIFLKKDAEQEIVHNAHNSGYLVLIFEWKDNVEFGGQDLFVTLGKRP